MGTILDLIQEIRKRPKLFLGKPTANNLYMFLSGYAHARKDAGPGDYDFLGGLNQWIHDRYQVTSTQGWAKIVEFYSMTEDDELTLFWKLFDEYLARRTSRRKKVS